MVNTVEGFGLIHKMATSKAAECGYIPNGFLKTEPNVKTVTCVECLHSMARKSK